MVTTEPPLEAETRPRGAGATVRWWLYSRLPLKQIVMKHALFLILLALLVVLIRDGAAAQCAM